MAGKARSEKGSVRKTSSTTRAPASPPDSEPSPPKKSTAASSKAPALPSTPNPFAQLRPERAWSQTHRSKAEVTPMDPVSQWEAADSRGRLSETPFATSATAPTPTTRPARRREPDTSGRVDKAQRSKRSGSSVTVAVLASVFAVALIILIAANKLLTSGPEPSTSVRAETQRPVVEVRGITSVEETFDGLPMDSTLAAPWTVSGGDTARVAALPTSVDRSLRITSSADGVATEACRDTDVPAGTQIRIAFDYRVSRVAAAPFQILSLQTSGKERLGLMVDARGSPIEILDGAPDAAVASPAPLVTAATSEWHGVELTIVHASGAVSLRAQDATGAETGSGTASLTDLAPEGIDKVCLRSPEASPSGWIAIDDLLIEG